MKSAKKVVLGLSGGVDSAVAAHLLLEQGFDVVGLTIKMWDGCQTDDAEAVAASLGIRHLIVDYREEFKTSVINYFASEYRHGRTPNPCIVCNPAVKFKALTEVARIEKADSIATGHYAHVIQMASGRYTLKAAEASGKDQTYALYRLTQEQLSILKTPCGDFTKSQIREFAGKIGLHVEKKPDSQEICFITNNDYVSYLVSLGVENKPGNFIGSAGNKIGRHNGIINYTIGQRKGLETSFGERMYVSKIIPATNDITLVRDSELYNESCKISDINYMGLSDVADGFKGYAKIRYAHRPSECRLFNTGGGLKCVFEEKQRAITPGQSVVVYTDGMIVCGGFIV